MFKQNTLISNSLQPSTRSSPKQYNGQYQYKFNESFWISTWNSIIVYERAIESKPDFTDSRASRVSLGQ